MSQHRIVRRVAALPVPRIYGALLLVVLISPWVLHWNLSQVEQFPRDPAVTHWHESQGVAGLAASNHQQLYSCHEIFGRQAIVWNGSCLQHRLLLWLSCPIGATIQIHTDRIQGSLGGENVTDVWNRAEAEENLVYEEGSLVVPQEISGRLLENVGPHVRRFLHSAAVGLSPTQATTPRGNTTLLVRRGNYANPCMAILSMYNVYIVLTYFGGLGGSGGQELQTPAHIVWLDGHARGDLDPVWQRLFQTNPVHIKQLGHPSAKNESTVYLHNAIVVNTMSAIGDEGLGLYQWNQASSKTTTSGTPNCQRNSTLVAFRDFVLARYGLTSSGARDPHRPPQLTLLLRKDYAAHPRSNGRTDRTLADVKEDVAYLQSQYPAHSIQLVSFEGMPFREQLEHIVKTDTFVAVHGAGNIHVLFLPDHSTFVEYIPKGFQRRQRFRYLAECLNLTYVAKSAWIESSALHRSKDRSKIQVRLRPINSYERDNELPSLRLAEVLAVD